VPFDTYHVDHLEELLSTKKSSYISYCRILEVCVVVCNENHNAMENILRKQRIVFGNLRHIILDQGIVFTSNDFQNYCKEENIEHVLIMTRIPKANGEAE
jgi:transposase InsO family protein